MKKIYLSSILIISILLNSCITSKNEKPESNFLPNYVAISPVSLPPIASKVKSDLLEIAKNLDSIKSIPHDLDLLVLTSSYSKSQFDFASMSGSIGSTVASTSGSKKRSYAIYDIMNIASYPIPLLLPKLDDENPERLLMVTPHIGVGIRIVAEYETLNGEMGLSLPNLAAELSANNKSGSVELQQIGISRYGTNNEGIVGLNLTPDNISTIMQNIGYMMGQIWLSDTRIQPMIIGYSIPGYRNIDARYDSTIVSQILDRRVEIMEPFVNSMYYEAREALGIYGDLTSIKDETVREESSSRLSNLERDINFLDLQSKIYKEFAVKNPDLIKNLTPEILNRNITSPNIQPSDAYESIIKEFENIKSLEAEN